MAIDGRILHGTVDCLVQTAPDRFTVLEFKTGRERPEHRTQVALYQRAMALVFPGAVVDARLAYAGASVTV
jgi:ATP-dependent exoDNAse (exonuclease V) beta subunit